MSEQGSLLVRGGRVLNPAFGFDAAADVLILDGTIATIAPPGTVAGADEVYEARGLVVAPGFIDLHAHLREPGQAYKETIATGTASAAAGGFTLVCAMPNTIPVNDLPALTRWMQQPERGAVVRLRPIAAATFGQLGEKLTDFAGLRREGAVAFSDDGRPLLHEGLMRQALEEASRLDAPVVQHAEDIALTQAGVMHQGPLAFRLGLRGMPSEAEWRIVGRDIRLAHETGGHLHVAHVSTAEAVELLRQGKRQGVHVTAEATPHHFSLTESDMPAYDANFKMNPPLRSSADREAVISALEDGTLDCIATDHAPHALHEKRMEFDRAPFGVIGFETALALAIRVLHRERGFRLARVVELLTAAPARILAGSRELRGHGTLGPGSPGDLAIFDPERVWTFDPASARSKARNSPFAGRKLMGKVVATIVGGRFVYREE